MNDDYTSPHRRICTRPGRIAGPDPHAPSAGCDLRALARWWRDGAIIPSQYILRSISQGPHRAYHRQPSIRQKVSDFELRKAHW